MRTTCSSGGVRRALIGWSAARVPEVADARRQRNQDNSCRVPCLRAEQLWERERSERGAVAACGEPSFRPGRREGGAGSRLPGREPSGNPRCGPIPDPGSLCDLGLSGQRRPPFPTCGPPPRWFGACQPRGRRAGHSLPRSRGGGQWELWFLTHHPQVNCGDEMAGQCQKLKAPVACCALCRQTG